MLSDTADWQPIVDVLGTLVREPQENHARSMAHAQSQNLAEVEIEGDDDRIVRLGSIDDLGIGCALHRKFSHVTGIVVQADEELHSPQGDSGVSQKPHRRQTGSVCS